jgi:hypothetical protein
MPVVPAGNIPYNPVPTVEPDVRGPTAFQDIRATPAAFGGSVGEATSQLGRGIERAGDVFAEAAIRRQGILNQVAADEAGNNTQDFVNKKLRGDPNNPNDTGFFGMHGGDAIREWPNVKNAIDQHINDTSAAFTNPRQKLLYDSETRRLRNYWMSEIGTHYDREFQQYGMATAKAGIDNAMTRAAQGIARGDDAAWQAGVGDAMRKSMDLLRLNGTSG